MSDRGRDGLARKVGVTMEGRGLVAGALALLATTVSCASPTDAGEGGESGEPAAEVEPTSGAPLAEVPAERPAEIEPEVPLELTLDHVDIAHGSMRMRATMADGSPDVSIVLGDGCDGREVGRGFATRVALTWALDAQDVADALRCDLVVRARAWAGRGRVLETTTLKLEPGVTPVVETGPEGDAVEPSPDLAGLGRLPTEMDLTFTSLSPSATLAIGGMRIERSRDENDEATDSPADGTFDVPYEAFARALLDDAPLRIDAKAFTTSVTIETMALEREPADGEGESEGESEGEAQTGEATDMEEAQGTEMIDGLAVQQTETTDPVE